MRYAGGTAVGEESRRWRCGSWWPVSRSATRSRDTTGPVTPAGSMGWPKRSARTVFSRSAVPSHCAAEPQIMAFLGGVTGKIAGRTLTSSRSFGTTSPTSRSPRLTSRRGAGLLLFHRRHPCRARPFRPLSRHLGARRRHVADQASQGVDRLGRRRLRHGTAVNQHLNSWRTVCFVRRGRRRPTAGMLGFECASRTP